MILISNKVFHLASVYSVGYYRLLFGKVQYTIPLLALFSKFLGLYHQYHFTCEKYTHGEYIQLTQTDQFFTDFLTRFQFVCTKEVSPANLPS